VRTAFEPFAQAGFTCITQSANGDTSAFDQWECDQTTENGTVLQLVIDADSTHVKQVLAVIDQSHSPGTTAAPAVDFFNRVTKIDLGSPADAIGAWIPSAIQAGGQMSFGSILVTLDALRPVCHLVLFAED
jgi:hypothetical protein